MEIFKSKMIRRSAIVFVSTLSLSFAAIGGAYAGSNIEEVKAYFNKGIKVLINGKETAFKDGDGNPVYPLVQNGSSYLPARALTHALGGEIDWSQETNTIAITTAVYGRSPIETDPYKDAKDYQGTPKEPEPRTDHRARGAQTLMVPIAALQERVNKIIEDRYNNTISDNSLYSVEYLEAQEKKGGKGSIFKYTLNRVNMKSIEYYFDMDVISIQLESDMNDWGLTERPYTTPEQLSHDITLIMNKSFDGSYVLKTLSSYKLAH